MLRVAHGNMAVKDATSTQPLSPLCELFRHLASSASTISPIACTRLTNQLRALREV